MTINPTEKVGSSLESQSVVLVLWANYQVAAVVKCKSWRILMDHFSAKIPEVYSLPLGMIVISSVACGLIHLP